MTDSATPRPWRWHESTCTHGGYGECKEGCKREGFWGHREGFDDEVWLGLMLWKDDNPFVLKAVNMHEHNEEAARLLRWLVTTKMPVFLLCAEADSFVAWENTDSALRGVVE